LGSDPLTIQPDTPEQPTETLLSGPPSEKRDIADNSSCGHNELQTIDKRQLEPRAPPAEITQTLTRTARQKACMEKCINTLPTCLALCRLVADSSPPRSPDRGRRITGLTPPKLENEKDWERYYQNEKCIGACTKSGLIPQRCLDQCGWDNQPSPSASPSPGVANEHPIQGNEPKIAGGGLAERRSTPEEQEEDAEKQVQHLFDPTSTDCHPPLVCDTDKAPIAKRQNWLAIACSHRCKDMSDSTIWECRWQCENDVRRGFTSVESLEIPPARWR